MHHCKVVYIHIKHLFNVKSWDHAQRAQRKTARIRKHESDVQVINLLDKVVVKIRIDVLFC